MNLVISDLFSIFASEIKKIGETTLLDILEYYDMSGAEKIE